MEKKIIKVNDFINYHKNPKYFWFLNSDEIKKTLRDEIYIDYLEELLSNEAIEVLENSFSTDKLSRENNRKILDILFEKSKIFFISRFNLETRNFYDFSKDPDSFEKLINTLKIDDNVFIFRPTILYKNLLLQPFAIYKYNQKIYLFEKSFSTSLKREIIGKLIFYKNIFEKLINLKIDQFLIVYIKNHIHELDVLDFEITNGLPYKAKKTQPKWSNDKTLRNVNTFFQLPILEFFGSLYEKFTTFFEYSEINNDSWLEYPYTEEQFWVSLKELKLFLDNPNREFVFHDMAVDYLSGMQNLIPKDGTLYKALMRNFFDNYTFSDKLIPYKKTLNFLMTLKFKEKQELFLKKISKLDMFELPETQKQECFIFEQAQDDFEKFNEKKIKIYYDFETVSLPFPTLHRSKPFAQLITQMSMIKEINSEISTFNLLFDPMEFNMSNYKKIIDTLCDDMTINEKEDTVFVVYNKSFENSRLKELKEVLDDSKYSKKIDWIIENTVDLAKWFSYDNNPYIIHKKMQGFYSIKKLIKVIPNQFLEEAKVIDYQELEICKNGDIAQHLMIKRILTYQSNNKEDLIWENIKKELIVYCENDVRVMISIKNFIEYLLQNNDYFYKLDQFLATKKQIYYNINS